MHFLTRHIAFTHSLLKKIALFFLLSLFYACGFFTAITLGRQEAGKIELEKKQCLSQLKQVSETMKKTSDQDLNLYAKKAITLENVVESKTYFSFKKIQLSSTKFEITISLIGGSTMKADASDFVMKYTDNLKIEEIKTGTAFPSYPRKNIINGEITVTGIASLDNSGIKFGEVNNVFSTFIVEKKGDIKQKGILSIDKERTQIFLNGKSVLDIAKMFSQIEL